MSTLIAKLYCVKMLAFYQKPQGHPTLLLYVGSQVHTFRCADTLQDSQAKRKMFTHSNLCAPRSKYHRRSHRRARDRDVSRNIALLLITLAYNESFTAILEKTQSAARAQDDPEPAQNRLFDEGQ